MNEKVYDRLLWNKLVKPVLIIAGVPLIICFLISFIIVILSEDYLFPAILILVFSTLYAMFVFLIGLGAGGLDFRNKYGLPEENENQKRR